MSEYNRYMWSVPDWRTDEMYLYLDNREQGIYRNLIDECWVSGSIVSNPEMLARFVHEPLDYFLAVWAKISKKFKPISNGSRYISPRLEQDRRQLMRNAKFNEIRAKKAADARWNKVRIEKEINANSNDVAVVEHAFEQCQSQLQEEKYSPSPDSPNTETSPVLPVGAPAKKRAGHRLDPAYESFIEVFERERAPAKYPRDKNRSKDFPQLAALRKTQGINGKSPPDWDIAIANYFASHPTSASVADLCARYPDFVKWQIDRYGKAVSGANGNGKSKSRQFTDEVLEQTRRINQQLLGKDPDGRGAEDGAGAGGRVPGGVIRIE